MSSSLRSVSVSHGVSSMQSSIMQRECQWDTQSTADSHNTYTYTSSMASFPLRSTCMLQSVVHGPVHVHLSQAGAGVSDWVLTVANLPCWTSAFVYNMLAVIHSVAICLRQLRQFSIWDLSTFPYKPELASCPLSCPRPMHHLPTNFNFHGSHGVFIFHFLTLKHMWQLGRQQETRNNFH